MLTFGAIGRGFLLVLRWDFRWRIFLRRHRLGALNTCRVLRRILMRRCRFLLSFT